MSQAINQPNLPDSHSFAQIAQGMTHYRIDGPTDGIKVLLIHGATVPAWEFDRLVPYLNEAGLQTIRADLLGHGYSERPDAVYDIGLFRDQLVGLLDHLNITDRLHIVGHSLGAAVGAELINSLPERFGKMVLAAPLVNFMENMPVLRLFSVPILGELMTRWYTIPMLKRRRRKRYAPVADGRFVGKFHTQFLLPGFEKALLSLFRHKVLGDQTSRYEKLQSMGHQCLILQASDDVVVTAQQIQYLQTILTSADTVVIADSPHSFMLTDPERVAPEIVAYLKSDSLSDSQ